jgi:hypothetical protein
MTQIFLSYSTKDAAFVNQLADNLRRAGFSIWKTPESILPSENWVRALERGLTTSSHFVLVQTPNAVKSEWVKLEFETALELYAEGRMVLITIDHQPTDTPLFWRRTQRVTMPDGSTGLLDLIRAIRDNQPIHQPIYQPAIINVQIDGDVSGSLNVAMGDILQTGPDAGRPRVPSIEPTVPERRADDARKRTEQPHRIRELTPPKQDAVQFKQPPNEDPELVALPLHRKVQTPSYKPAEKLHVAQDNPVTRSRPASIESPKTQHVTKSNGDFRVTVAVLSLLGTLTFIMYLIITSWR